MSRSAPITITSAELREQVEDYLDRQIPDHVWERSEPYARRKINMAREREPEADCFNNEYLVLLTADTVRETEFSDYTMIACGLLMEARAK